MDTQLLQHLLLKDHPSSIELFLYLYQKFWILPLIEHAAQIQMQWNHQYCGFKHPIQWLFLTCMCVIKNKLLWGFPGGAVVENLPANAVNTGSSPGLGRSHMPLSNWAREPQLLSLRVWSLCSATREAAIVRGPRTAVKSGPRSPQLEKALAQKRKSNTAKNKLKKKKKKRTSCSESRIQQATYWQAEQIERNRELVCRLEKAFLPRCTGLDASGLWGLRTAILGMLGRFREMLVHFWDSPRDAA